MAGKWSPVRFAAFYGDTMLLLTDGRVMVHQLDSNAWWALTPDPSSADPYVDGAWSPLAPMPNNPIIPTTVGGPTNAPKYFASAVLKDGRVFVAGGEYNAGIQNANTLATQIYNPDLDAWTTIAAPAGWGGIGDAPSCVLFDGRVLLGEYSTRRTALYNPVANTWTPAGAGGGKGDSCNEETWTLLPDGNVLSVQCSNVPNAEEYVAASDRWRGVGSTPSPLPQPCGSGAGEIGPAILLPDGRVFAIGSTGNTALYSRGAVPPFSAGPTFQDGAGNRLYPMDAPACLLPNGRVLCAAGSAPPCSFPPPTFFFEYDPAKNALIAVPSPWSVGSVEWYLAVYHTRMLLLPTGQVMLTSTTTDFQIYTPDGAPDPSWAPTITQYPAKIVPGCSYNLVGTQFNGLSQAVSYGDDAQMATNYPLVRIYNLLTRTTRYCKTFNHSLMAVATGAAPVSTSFRAAANPPLDPGPSLLNVVANGVLSAPVPVTVESPFVPFYREGDPGTGIGGYDLASPLDQVFAFDYNSGGKLDHLVLYRPGTGIIWVVEHVGGTVFNKVYPGKGDPLKTIGGYDLVSQNDRAFAFDYNSSGKLDHMVLYRPGTGIIHVVEHAGKFTTVYPGKGDPLKTIGGYDLASFADRAFAFDYNSSGKLDHMVLYRPGTGIIQIVEHAGGKFTRVYPDPLKGDPLRTIGGYDLASVLDQVFAFDYDGSGKLDHLVLYRPGTGSIWILKHDASGFSPVYSQGDPGSGIGSYDLRRSWDQVLAFDYDGSSKLDHLVLYRPGNGAIYILRNNGGNFMPPLYAAGDPGPGIGGYDLRRRADRIFTFDFNGTGRLDHLALYRPGTGTIWILGRTPCF